MSIFENNTRFSVLAEEEDDKSFTKVTKKNKENKKKSDPLPQKETTKMTTANNNAFKGDGRRKPSLNPQQHPSTSHQQSILQKSREMAREKEQRLQQEKEIQQQRMLQMENFPELELSSNSSLQKKSIGSWNTSLQEIHLKQRQDADLRKDDPQEISDFDRLPYGWTILTFHPETGQPTRLYKKFPTKQRHKYHRKEDMIDIREYGYDEQEQEQDDDDVQPEEE